MEGEGPVLCGLPELRTTWLDQRTQVQHLPECLLESERASRRRGSEQGTKGWVLREHQPQMNWGHLQLQTTWDFQGHHEQTTLGGEARPDSRTVTTLQLPGDFPGLSVLGGPRAFTHQDFLPEMGTFLLPVGVTLQHERLQPGLFLHRPVIDKSSQCLASGPSPGFCLAFLAERALLSLGR